MSEVPPTRMNQQVFKGKKKAAESGHKLLKKKADALKVKFRDYAKMIAETKGTMSTDATTAFFSLTQAEYAAGNFKQKVAEGTLTARVRVGAGIDNVAGVKLPVFTIYETGGPADNQSLGLIGGGKKVVQVRERFTVFLSQLIKLASLQTSFVTLDEAMKVTNRRVNALENVTIPKIQNVLDYIDRELDELEREDFTRLKLVQGKKEEVTVNVSDATNKMSKLDINQDKDITATFDAQDDEDVVF
ncbi:v-type h-atpase subunit [Chaetoceros tenuissimus]|uniref:V-type h-atpase subunit n=1 Tax=Chaetoceros tenuissimus TaxID=426638 RepID=A0AAD3DBE9_9STRA|nr:v-type h-atpase subunit [Chaetoceros tenuissimus]